METEAEFFPQGYTEEKTHAWPIPQGLEKTDLEVKSRRYVLEKQHEVMTQATAVPTPSDTASALFEYDITGPRVRATGQTTGGYIKEVAENEAAFAHSLQDEVSLYIMQKIASSKNPVHIDDIESVLGHSKGWMRVALMIKGGLLDLVGTELRTTERGIRELEAIRAYCKLQKK
jgi:hypothetical protein